MNKQKVKLNIEDISLPHSMKGEEYRLREEVEKELSRLMAGEPPLRKSMQVYKHHQTVSKIAQQIHQGAIAQKNSKKNQ